MTKIHTKKIHNFSFHCAQEAGATVSYVDMYVTHGEGE